MMRQEEMIRGILEKNEYSNETCTLNPKSGDSRTINVKSVDPIEIKKALWGSVIVRGTYNRFTDQFDVSELVPYRQLKKSWTFNSDSRNDMYDFDKGEMGYDYFTNTDSSSRPLNGHSGHSSRSRLRTA